jgi:hypothetical protein
MRMIAIVGDSLVVVTTAHRDDLFGGRALNAVMTAILMTDGALATSAEGLVLAWKVAVIAVEAQWLQCMRHDNLKGNKST